MTLEARRVGVTKARSDGDSRPLGCESAGEVAARRSDGRPLEAGVSVAEDLHELQRPRRNPKPKSPQAVRSVPTLQAHQTRVGIEQPVAAAPKTNPGTEKKLSHQVFGRRNSRSGQGTKGNANSMPAALKNRTGFVPTTHGYILRSTWRPTHLH